MIVRRDILLRNNLLVVLLLIPLGGGGDPLDQGVVESLSVAVARLATRASRRSSLSRSEGTRGLGSSCSSTACWIISMASGEGEDSSAELALLGTDLFLLLGRLLERLPRLPLLFPSFLSDL